MCEVQILQLLGKSKYEEKKRIITASKLDNYCTQIFTLFPFTFGVIRENEDSVLFSLVT